MQSKHDQSKVSTLRRTERIRSAPTPDKPDVRGLDTTSISSPKRAAHTSRFSMMPTSMNTSVINLRKMELENNNLEAELLYSQYVASYAELFLEQEALKETAASFNKSLKKACKETKSLHETCKLIETRVNDTKALSLLNDLADSIHSIIKNFQEKQEQHKTENILKHLRQLLDRFSILRCENVILPKSPEEMEQFKKTLQNCSTLLTEVKNIFMFDELEAVASEYKEFLTMCKEVSSLKKMAEEKICELQIEHLKLCSNILSQAEEDGE